MNDRLAVYSLLAGCVVFGVVTFAELESGWRRETVTVGTSAKRPSAAAASQQHAAEIDELVATALARPLFNESRRPPQQSADETGADLGFGNTRLSGILTAPGQRIAIFTVPGTNSVVLTEGQTLSGWQIEYITPREVSLDGPAGKRTLQPEGDAGLVVEAPKLTLQRVLPDQQTRDEE
jgi:hypothetical protein